MVKVRSHSCVSETNYQNTLQNNFVNAKDAQINKASAIALSSRTKAAIALTVGALAASTVIVVAAAGAAYANKNSSLGYSPSDLLEVCYRNESNPVVDFCKATVAAVTKPTLDSYSDPYRYFKQATMGFNDPSVACDLYERTFTVNTNNKEFEYTIAKVVGGIFTLPFLAEALEAIIGVVA